MIAAQKPQAATWDDLVALPEHVRAEVIDGSIEVQPSPLPRHSRVQRTIGSKIGGPFDDDDGRGGPGGWWVFSEVDVRLEPHTIVVPDVSGWRRSRLIEPWETRPIDDVPDWVCEIVSPSNARRDHVTKRNLYARFGIPFYWICDPAERTLLALRLVDGGWVEIGAYDDTMGARIAPFEAIELEVGLLFPPVAPTPGAQ